MAFIDWLKKQHADSLRASQRMAADPFLRGIKPGAMNFPGPPVRNGLTEDNILPFQKTNMGFFARGYNKPDIAKKEDLVKKVMIEKNDGTKEIKSEWEEPRFPVHQGNVRATALPSGPAVSAPNQLRMNPSFGGLPLDISRWGGQRGQIENQAALGMMASDPGWAGVPRARQQRSLANMGMDLRPRLGMPGQAESLARIPRQQMPPPRFAPRVDPRQFPTVQDRGLGTYNIGEPGVQMGGGFDWTGRALKENVGEDFRNIGERYTNWWKNLVEESKRTRQRGNY